MNKWCLIESLIHQPEILECGNNRSKLTEKIENISSAEELFEDLMWTPEVESSHAATKAAAESGERIKVEIAVVRWATTATATRSTAIVSIEAFFAVSVIDLSLVTLIFNKFKHLLVTYYF